MQLAGRSWSHGLLDNDTIKELLARSEIGARDKLLICLAQEPPGPRKPSDIRDFAFSLGLRDAKKWNVSAYLSRAKGLCINTSAGWELTAEGKNRVAEVAGPLLPPVTILVLSALRKQLTTINGDATRAFVEESIKALEARLYRSAIVLSWVGAVSVLYDHVVAAHLPTFNAEQKRRDPKWRDAKNADGLARMGEYDFLQVAAALSIIGKNVKDELETCLKLRNGCGHPNSLEVGEHRTAAHIETLLQNVFAKF